MPGSAHWPPPPRKSYYDGRPNAALMPCWTCQAQTAAVIAATGCPRSFFWSHGDKVAITSFPPLRSPRYRRDMRFPPPTDSDYNARARTPDYERIRTRTHIRSATRGAASAHAVPSPSPHRTSQPQAKERENDGRYPCLRWPGRSFAFGARGKLAQVKLIKPAPPPRQQREDGPTRPPTRPSAPA